MRSLLALIILATLLVCEPKVSYASDHEARTKTPEQEKVIKALIQADPDSRDHSPGCINESNDGYYKLGPHDKLFIRVFNEDDLSGHYTVDSRGSIMMPLIGEVIVNKCSIAKAKDIITRAYSDGYLVTPSISIEVSEYRPFYILGEVTSPGSYEYRPQISVLSAAALAGGFTYRADKRDFLVYKEGTSPQKAKTVSSEYRIQPGDVIVVDERLF